MWKLSPKKAKCNDVFSADEFDRAVAVEASDDGKFVADSAKLADLIILPNGKKRGHQSLKITLPPLVNSIRRKLAKDGDDDYAKWWLHLKVLLLQQQPINTQKPLDILDENCFVSEL